MTWWPKSIRARLAGTITAALALVLAFVSVTTYLLVRDTLYRNIDNELAVRTQLISAQLDRAKDASVASARFVQSAFDPDHPANIQILTRDGLPVFSSPAGLSRKLPTSILREYQTNDTTHLRCYSLATPLYFISMALPVDDADASLRALRLTLGIAMPVALLASLLLGYRIAKRGLAPIDEITTTAHRITSLSLRKRIPSTGTDDELGRLVTTLNEMIERLEGSFTAITKFTTNAAHEMRTPLTILRGEMELALRKKTLAPDARAVLESNVEEVNRLITIVEDLFTLARADSNALTLAFEIVELDELVQQLASKIAAHAEPKQLHVEYDIHPRCTIVGDRNRLIQVVLILVDNAVKYTGEGGTLRVGCIVVNANAELRISDTGMGIDPVHHEKIFERFYRADEARTRSEGGTGLGLAIAESIVAAHHGRIRVESAPGKGSTFIVTVPLAEVE